LAKNAFPELKPRRYCLNLDGIMIPAESFVLGRAFSTNPQDLVKIIDSWAKWRQSFGDDFPFLFSFGRKYRVWAGETRKNGDKQERVKNLFGLSLDEKIIALKDKIFTKNKSLNIWDCFGHKTEKNKSNYAFRRIHGEKLVLSGQARHISEAGKESKPEFYDISVEGPYLHSSPQFSQIIDQCSDSVWTQRKAGRKKSEIITTHLGGLIEYVYKNPQSIETFAALKSALRKDGHKLRIFCPFHTDYVRREILDFFEQETLEHIVKSRQPPLDFLVADVLFAKFVAGMGSAGIGKRLLKLPMYDSLVVQGIMDRKISFDIIPQSQLFGVMSPVSRAVKKIYASIKRMLTDKEGLEQNYFCLEKKDSAYETGAACFRPKDSTSNECVEEARVLFNKDFPPVIARRSPLPHAKVYPFKQRPRSGARRFAEMHQHPFSELYLPPFLTRRFDDRRREYSFWTVELPGFIPDALVPEYALHIGQRFPGGFNRLKELVKTGRYYDYKKKIRVNVSNIVNLPRLSLVNTLHRAYKNR